MRPGGSRLHAPEVPASPGTGSNLLEVLEDQPNGLAPELVRRYVYQLCRAIAWCHQNGVIHRGA